MSGPPIQDCYEQTYSLTANHAITVTDQYRTAQVININPSGTRYFRTWLAPSTDATASTALTEATAKSLLSHINAKINDGVATPQWEFSLISNTLIQIKYLGTGLGSITWGSTTLRDLLGYNTNLTPLSTNAFAWGAFPPTHIVFADGRINDSGWITEKPIVASARLPDGTVYGWSATNQGYLRRLTTALHPLDHTVKVSSEIDALATPMFPAKSVWSSIDATPGVDPPWTVIHMLKTAMFKRIAVAVGTFQTLVAGTTTAYDECMLHPEQFELDDQPVRVDPNWNALWNHDLVFSWIREQQRV